MLSLNEDSRVHYRTNMNLSIAFDGTTVEYIT